MKKYEIRYWERESVWVYRTAQVPLDKDPRKMTEEELKNVIEQNEDVDFMDGDYNWETAETWDYDFKNDFKVEEVK